MRDIRDCLAAALTLLIHHGLADEEQLSEIIREEGTESLYDHLNEKYKEIYEG